MVFKIKNSLGNKLEEFKPIKGNYVGLYTCGPTIYNYAHIGNFRAYVWEDLLKRYLIFLGYNVKHVMNLTDVDDKTIKGSKEENIPLEKYTEKYESAFFEDIKKLNILPASVYPKATETINEMVNIIQKLLDKKVAYYGEDGSIYFSIKKFPEYGKLAGINIKKLKDGARVKNDEYEKENIGDFALWKAWDENDGEVYWETKLGKGRPGWHIECSAMSQKYLGSSFDMHCGGIDNKFPHHENEIAQSEAANGVQFVKYWLHCEHLLVNGKKMSKSLKNFYTLRDLLDEGFNANAIRYTLLNSQYRQQLNFTLKSLKDSFKTIQGLQRTIERLKNITQESSENKLVNDLIDTHLEKFKAGMNDDLNVPQAMASIFEFNKEVNKLIDEDALGENDAKNCINFFKKIDNVLAIFNWEEEFVEINENQEKLIKEREIARKEKNWAKSDEIRDQLKKEGIELIDNKNGSTTFKKIK